MMHGAILHYRVLERMGAGGMGIVYRASDTRLGREVALKFLPDSTRLDATSRRRLHAEARAAASLDHPNVGVIHAIEEVDDRLFLVMALYEGESLRARIDRASLGLHEAVDVAAQAARGLHRAHEAGIVHRDVKPDNLFLSREGTVKVLDFGLAKQELTDGLTSTGSVVGTLEYMSPEQIRGQAVDARTDVWALGVVLYEMLTGISPYRCDSGMPASILRIIKDDPIPLRDLRPDAPAGLAEVVGRALRKDRDTRYAGADELVSDLTAVLDHAGTLGAGPPTALAVVRHAVRPQAAVTGPLAPPSTPKPVEAPPGPMAPAALPLTGTPLVGRQDELDIIATHLADPHCRILTLVGPGGTGKTRLAIEAARHYAEAGAFTDGVFFVPLDGVSDAELIPAAVARAVGVELAPQFPALLQLERHLGNGTVLLILDNFEHVMDGAEVPSELVRACPGLRVVVTTRERLNLDEEWALPLMGLSAPGAEVTTVEDAERHASVQLFLHRAKRTHPRFALQGADAHHIGHICRLVGGSPLGIELAATWVKMMPCEEIAREIDSCMDFLASSSRNVSERHRSVRACFEYSWTLLTSQEQDVLARLSVFQSPFSREAAKAVADASLQVLATLVDKSLLHADAGRYECHPLLHHYGAEKLAEHPEARDATEKRHGAHVLAYVGRQLGAEDELAKLDAELSEVLVAMKRAHARNDTALLVALMLALAVDGRYYAARGHTTSSLELLRAAADAATSAGEDMSAHRLLGKLGDTLRLHHGETETALQAYRQALELAERLGDPHREAVMLSLVGQTLFERGADDADAYLDRAYALAREHHDALALNHVLQHQGFQAGARHDWTAAHALFAEALGVLEADPTIPPGKHENAAYQRFMALLNLGEAERMLGRHADALSLRRRALAMAEARDNRLWRAYALHEIGEVYHGMNERAQARVHFVRALQLWDHHHVPHKADHLRAFMRAEGYAIETDQAAS